MRAILSMCGAHPRLRGEHWTWKNAGKEVPGSSPPARGALRYEIDQPGSGRLIPACAGSTPESDHLPCRATAHPRLRGEHARPEATSRPPTGSSPPARGARLSDTPTLRLQRLIPACAGSTLRDGQVRSPRRAHPRLRGEHRVCRCTSRGATGSSPPARGARWVDEHPQRRPGLIPACAGSTVLVCCRSSLERAHPRLRGEHAIGCCCCTQCSGSSPPARGALHPEEEYGAPAGLIPACAGSTLFPSTVTPTNWAHPRLRGEHGVDCGAKYRVMGSSPPARGARISLRARERQVGLIPACAGSTADAPSPSPVPPAHPRLRGEHLARCLW